MLVIFLFLGAGVPEVLAGFSDGLVGKGKASTAPSAGKQQENNSPTREMGQAPIDSAIQPKVAIGVGKSVAQAWFDVVGLRLGMTQDEAVRAVQQRKREVNGKPISFEVLKEGPHQVLVKGAEPRIKFVALSDGKSVLQAFDLSEEASKNPSDGKDPRIQQFSAGGQIEVFEFQFPNVPNDARVNVLTRLQRLAPAVQRDTVKAALLKKYGQPTIDDAISMVWLLDQAGSLMTGKDVAKCRGATLPPGAPVGVYDYSITALKGCGEQLTVQIQGTLEAAMLIQTTLFHHQRLVDERDATQKAMLSRYGLTPEQTKQAPAPQF